MKVKFKYVDILEYEIEIMISKKNINLEYIKNFFEKMEASNLKFYKGNQDYFINLNDILFFETTDDCVVAHTSDNFYIVKNKLYELEKLLPPNFIRSSKSTIINKNKIYSLTRSVTKPGLVTFSNSHKKTYISRMYYKKIKEEF